MVGKPYAGKLHIRFDEGGQDFGLGTTLNGHEAGNGGYRQELAYRQLSLSATLPIAPTDMKSKDLPLMGDPASVTQSRWLVWLIA